MIASAPCRRPGGPDAGLRQARRLDALGPALTELDGRALESLAPGGPDRALSVDVEDWYHANFRSLARLDEERLPRRAEEGVDRLLAAFSERGARASFFVLGCVAREHPGLVRRIAESGHEVACHGMTHDLCYEQTPAEFRRAVADARALLSDQAGRDVVGFRAPSWSITRRSLWALDVLVEEGFRWDSSIFPAANYLYGVDGAPLAPYRVHTRSGPLVEAPPALLRLGRTGLGVGGGFYLRLLPWWIHRLALRRTARRGGLFVAYVHPREFDPDSWELELPLSALEGFVHRFGLRRLPGRIARLLAEGSWRPIGEVLAARGALDRAAA